MKQQRISKQIVTCLKGAKIISVEKIIFSSDTGAAKVGEKTCMSFRIHVQAGVQFRNSAQLAAFYKWMTCVMTDAYYAAEKDFVTPDEEFEMPVKNTSDCVICNKKE